MSTVTTSPDVLVDWMPRLASMQADLEAILNTAEPLCALRRESVTQLRASKDHAAVSTHEQNDCLAFLQSLLQVEQLVVEISQRLAHF